VVVRESDSALLAELRQTMQDRTPIVVTTAHAAAGMGSSLADGIRGVGEWDYVFVGLGDMPWVREDTLRTLDESMVRARRTRRPCIVLPVYAGAPGHPVGFSCEFFGELLALTGDEGARAVVRAHPETILRVDVDDPGVVTDLDQPPS
jgi:molybdenum cofactor cytidylyltransferase